MPRAKGQTPEHVKVQRRAAFETRARAERLATAARPNTDQELIEQAVAAGRVTHCPSALANGALKWKPFDK